jgi:uncharacterized protein YbaA (DUF1428 family)
MTYVDAFVLSVPKDKVESYRSMLSESSVLWKEFGALSYVESLADDVPYGELTSFPRAVQAKGDELVVLSWVTWPSREARDAGNKKVMSDPRMTALMEKLPVDGNRMIFGGFRTMIEA